MAVSIKSRREKNLGLQREKKVFPGTKNRKKMPSFEIFAIWVKKIDFSWFYQH